MGYKSILRSLSAAANASARESERTKKRLEREQERMEKKILKLEEKKAKITDSLNDLFAKGKIDKKEYEKLLKRESEIAFDLLVFGKTAATSAAKRYICGKVDKEEFQAICETIIPSEVSEEKQEIIEGYDQLLEEIKDFVKSCRAQENQCHKCSKKKGIFRPLSDIGNMKLCKKCKKELNKLLNHKGMNGTYFYVSPHMISLDEIEDCQIQINIQQDHF